MLVVCFTNHTILQNRSRGLKSDCADNLIPHYCHWLHTDKHADEKYDNAVFWFKFKPNLFEACSRTSLPEGVQVNCGAGWPRAEQLRVTIPPSLSTKPFSGAAISGAPSKQKHTVCLLSVANIWVNLLLTCLWVVNSFVSWWWGF